MRSAPSACVAALALLLLALASLAPLGASAVSYELKVTNVRGLPTEGKAAELTSRTAAVGQPTYRIIARECVHGACATMGINSLAKLGNSLFSSDNLPEDTPFMLNLRVQQQTLESHSRERVEIVSMARTSVRRGADGAKDDDDMQPVLRVSAGKEGKSEGPVGLLHPLYRIEQKHVVEFLLTVTSKELRGCAKSTCKLSTGVASTNMLSLPSDPVKIGDDAEPIALEFSLRLHEDIATETEASVDHFALAAHFAEHAYKWGVQDAAKGKASHAMKDPSLQIESATVDMAPTTTGAETGLSWSARTGESLDGFPTSYCPTYRHVATIKGGKAHVWYLNNKVGSADVPQIVIAFHGSQPQGGTEDENVGNEQFDLFKLAGTNDLPYLGKVARQYNRDYNSVSNELRDFIVPRSTVLITGYSRSSGMATLATADLALDESANVGKLYGVTFGSPQVGDISFLRAFRQKVTQSPRFGYFKRIVAADASSSAVKVDPEVVLPGGFNEYISTFPAVKNVDCIRSFADVAAIPRLASGHLSLYIHVGSRVLIFENGKQSPPSSTTASLSRPSSFLSSKSDVYDFANSMAPYSASGRMNIYVERLRLAQKQMLHRRSVATGKTLKRSSNVTLRKHVATLLKTLPWRASVAAQAGGTRSTAENDDIASEREGVCSANNVYRQPMTVRLMLENPDLLAGDERVAVSICEEKRKCYAMLPVARDSQAMSTVPEARLMRSTYYATHRQFDPNNMKLKLSIVKQAKSPNCRSSMSTVFPPEQVTTKVAPSVRIEAGHVHGMYESPSGKIRVGDLKVAFVVRVPLGGDAAIAAGGPYGDRSGNMSEDDHGHMPSAEDEEVSQDQVVEAEEIIDEGDDAEAATPPDVPKELPVAPQLSANEDVSSAHPSVSYTPPASEIEPAVIPEGENAALSRHVSTTTATNFAPSTRAQIGSDYQASGTGMVGSFFENLQRKSSLLLGPGGMPKSPQEEHRRNAEMQARMARGPSDLPEASSSYMQTRVRQGQATENTPSEGEPSRPAYDPWREPSGGKGYEYVTEATRLQIGDTAAVAKPIASINNPTSDLGPEDPEPAPKFPGVLPEFPKSNPQEHRSATGETSPDLNQAVPNAPGGRGGPDGLAPLPPVSHMRKTALSRGFSEESVHGMVREAVSSVPTTLSDTGPEDPVSAPEYPGHGEAPPFPRTGLPSESGEGTGVPPGEGFPKYPGEARPFPTTGLPSKPGRRRRTPPGEDVPPGETIPGSRSRHPIDTQKSPIGPQPVPSSTESGGDPPPMNTSSSGHNDERPSGEANTGPEASLSTEQSLPAAETSPQPVSEIDIKVRSSGSDASLYDERLSEGNSARAGGDLPPVHGSSSGYNDERPSGEANKGPEAPVSTEQSLPAAETSSQPVPEIDIKVRSSGSDANLPGERLSDGTSVRVEQDSTNSSASNSAIDDYNPNQEISGGKGYELVEEATRQGANQASEGEIVEPEGSHRFEIGSNLLPMAPVKKNKLMYGLKTGSRGLESRDIDKTGGDSKETCTCTTSSATDCAVPIQGKEGKCALSNCERPRCDASGSFQCTVTRSPQHVVLGSVDLLKASIGDEVDCALNAEAVVPVVDG